MKFLLLSLLSFSIFANDGLKLAKEMFYANQPKDSIQQVEMTLIADGTKKTRKFLSVSKTNKIVDNNSIIQFLEPRKSRGVSLLTKNKAQSDADQYIYLPALKKVRRVSSSKKSGRFVGSDIYFEDLQVRHYSKNNYKIIKKNKKFAILQSTPKDDSSIYTKVVSKVDLAKKMAIETQFYVDGKLDKTVKVSDIKKINGIWIPMQIAYKNMSIKHETKLKVLDVKLDKGVKNSIFSKKTAENERFHKKYL